MKRILLVLMLNGAAVMAASSDYALEQEFERRHVDAPQIDAYFAALSTGNYDQAAQLVTEIQNLMGSTLKNVKTSDIKRMNDLIADGRASQSRSPDTGSDALRTQLQQKTDEFNRAQKEIQDKDKEITQLKDQLQRCGTIPGESLALRKEIDQLREERGGYKQQIADLQKNVEQERAKTDAKVAEVTRLMQEKDKLAAQVSQETARCDRADLSMQTLVNELKTTREQGQQTAAQLKTCQADKKALQDQLANKGVCHDSNVAEWERRVSDLQAALAQQTAQNNALNDQVKASTDQIKTLSDAKNINYRHLFGSDDNALLRVLSRFALGNVLAGSTPDQMRRTLRTLYYSLSTIIARPDDIVLSRWLGPEMKIWYQANPAALKPAEVDPNMPDYLQKQYSIDLTFVEKEMQQKSANQKVANHSRSVSKRAVKAA